MRALLRALPDIVRTISGLAIDPLLPKAAKVALAAAVLYLVSPIDLIPDFIPVLGLLDDLVLLPLGILLVVWLLPPDVMAEHRARAGERPPASRTAAAVIVGIWLALAGLAAWALWRRYG